MFLDILVYILDLLDGAAGVFAVVGVDFDLDLDLD